MDQLRAIMNHTYFYCTNLHGKWRFDSFSKHSLWPTLGSSWINVRCSRLLSHPETVVAIAKKSDATYRLMMSCGPRRSNALQASDENIMFFPLVALTRLVALAMRFFRALVSKARNTYEYVTCRSFAVMILLLAFDGSWIRDFKKYSACDSLAQCRVFEVKIKAAGEVEWNDVYFEGGAGHL